MKMKIKLELDCEWRGERLVVIDIVAKLILMEVGRVWRDDGIFWHYRTVKKSGQADSESAARAAAERELGVVSE